MVVNDDMKLAILSAKEDDIIILRVNNGLNSERYAEIKDTLQSFIDKHKIKNPFLIIQKTIDVKTMSIKSLEEIRERINVILEKRNEKHTS